MQNVKNIFFIASVFFFISCSPGSQTKENIWILSELLKNDNPKISISGNPLADSNDASFVCFNGVNDAIFLDTIPLKNMSVFTVEAVIFPETGGAFEQRFLHMGEVKGDRVLMELRANEDTWYFDSYICSDGNKIALIDSSLTHPLNQWYHVAFVVNNGQLSSYVNGQKELSGEISMIPFKSGKTSIGVRLNKVCWYKGKISKIKITPKALNPNEFISQMNYK